MQSNAIAQLRCVRQPDLESELAKGRSNLIKQNGSGQVPFMLTYGSDIPEQR